MLAAAPSVWATSITFNFNSPTGDLGTSESYTAGGITITAYGYFSNFSATNLYGKNDGGDEVGLGLKYESNHEIPTNGFVQLDLQNLWNADPTALSMAIGSVQSGEGWKIYGSNTLGSRGTSLITSGTTDYPNTFNLSTSIDSYRYISVQASCGDVLISTLTANIPNQIPEPGSMFLMGSGLIGMAGAIRRKLRK